MGLLEAHGTLNLTQFWPLGTSDADTVKLTLKLGADAIRFEGKRTKVFAQATIAGKPVVGAKGQLTVRLQGIDAPELHYRPTFRKRTRPELSKLQPVNGDFRQPLAETAVAALGAFLATAGADPMPCIARTAVSKPGDVFDMYGRFIGDVYVRLGHVEVDLNHWLLQRGWAFPALYNSMTNDEIRAVLSLAQESERAQRGIWAHRARDEQKFDFERVFRKPGKSTPTKDQGVVSFPKLFRRVSVWRVLSAAKLTTETFNGYLTAAPDGCYLTPDFLSLRAGTQMPAPPVPT